MTTDAELPSVSGVRSLGVVALGTRVKRVGDESLEDLSEFAGVRFMMLSIENVKPFLGDILGVMVCWSVTVMLLPEWAVVSVIAKIRHR